MLLMCSLAQADFWIVEIRVRSVIMTDQHTLAASQTLVRGLLPYSGLLYKEQPDVYWLIGGV